MQGLRLEFRRALIRLALLEVDEDSRTSAGVLTSAYRVMRDDDTTEQDRRALRELLDWFEANLPVPPALSYEGTERALSWYYPTAKEPIAKTWEIAEILGRQGIQVQLLKTKKPGFVIYRDEHQVVAFPPRGKARDW